MRGGALVLSILVGLSIYAGVEAVRALRAERSAAEAAHASSVRLVRMAMELQAELDEQEEEDRRTLQLYLSLERELLPKLQHDLGAVVEHSSCPQATRDETKRVLSQFGERAHRHSQEMLDGLHREASRAHRRAKDLAQNVLQQARADRERLQQNGGAQWSDADLDGPLSALMLRLRRPNATFALPETTLYEWEEAYREMMHAGGAGADQAIARRIVQLARAAPLPPADPARMEVLRTDDPTEIFTALLQRARLHRHLPALLNALSGWQQHHRPVWDVIEMIETLRAQHVFPMSMLRLAEHEWDHILHGAAHAADRAPHAFDADQ